MTTTIIFSLLIFIFIVVICFFYFRHKWRKELGYRKNKRAGYGYIYWYRGGCEPSNLLLVKCGRTNNLMQRMRAAKTSNPFGIQLLAAIRVKSDVYAEKFIHDKFNSTRLYTNIVNLKLFMYWILTGARKQQRLKMRKVIEKQVKKNEWFFYFPMIFYMICVKDYKLTKEYKDKLNER